MWGDGCNELRDGLPTSMSTDAQRELERAFAAQVSTLHLERDATSWQFPLFLVVDIIEPRSKADKKYKSKTGIDVSCWLCCNKVKVC